MFPTLPPPFCQYFQTLIARNLECQIVNDETGSFDFSFVLNHHTTLGPGAACDGIYVLCVHNKCGVVVNNECGVA